MLRPTMLLTAGAVAAMTLIAHVVPVSAGANSNKGGDDRQTQAEPTRTGKERLGGKASDQQRVDNCKVPLDLRGSTPRPDDCTDRPGTKSER